MANSTGDLAFSKIEYPPSGFILQKDVYTTNLLYANDQFPLRQLKQRLPFRHTSMGKIPDFNSSFHILHQSGNISESTPKKDIHYLSSTHKPKPLNRKKLKFPFPKIKTIPLSSLNLYEDIGRRDVKIKNMDDDLNIYSRSGKKIFYRYKESKLDNSNKSNFPLILRPSDALIKKLTKKNKYINRRENDRSMDKISLTHIINQLNNELRDLKQNEIDRKRSFIKDKFFSTQIYIENFMDSSNEKNNSPNYKINDYKYNKNYN